MTAVDEFKAAQAKLLERHGVEADSRFFEVPVVSGSVHALVSGEGPPVVLVPGFADPAAMWSSLMGRLPGFALHAVDRPGFGLTGSASYETVTFRGLAIEFLEHVLDELELQKPLFVANSIGSLWVLWLAIERPDRVAGMVHLGCPACVLGTSAPLPMRLMSVRLVGRLLTGIASPSPAQVRRFGRMVGADLTGQPELQRLLVAAQRLPGARDTMLDLLGAVMRPGGPRRALVLEAEDLAHAPQPSLLVWGGRDPFGSLEIGRQVAAYLPDCELRILPDAGHVPWIDHPDEVASSIRPFLEKQPIRAG